MRKTLLMTAAALAAGVISSQAQNAVYSQNIVGYVNTPVSTTAQGGVYYLAAPFSVTGTSIATGALETNTADLLFSTNIPTGTVIYEWNGSGLSTYLFDDTDPNSWGSSVPAQYQQYGNNGLNIWWYLGDDATPTNVPYLPPGFGFILSPAGNLTNVWAGTVAVNVGNTNTTKFNTANLGNTFYVGCPIPYGGRLDGYQIATNSSNQVYANGGANLQPPAGTTIYQYGPAPGHPTAGYLYAYLYDNTDPNGWGSAVPAQYQQYCLNGIINGTNVTWYLGDDATPTNPPVNVPGGAFVMSPGGNFNWTVGL